MGRIGAEALNIHWGKNRPILSESTTDIPCKEQLKRVPGVSLGFDPC